jgi:hypothetical protein
VDANLKLERLVRSSSLSIALAEGVVGKKTAVEYRFWELRCSLLILRRFSVVKLVPFRNVTFPCVAGTRADGTGFGSIAVRSFLAFPGRLVGDWSLAKLRANFASPSDAQRLAAQVGEHSALMMSSAPSQPSQPSLGTGAVFNSAMLRGSVRPSIGIEALEISLLFLKGRKEPKVDTVLAPDKLGA